MAAARNNRPEPRRSPDADLACVAMLGDRARRVLYAYVASQDHPVSRDDAADATGMKRATAAFHLDRMAEEGLLDVGFARLSGRTGPGAGRTAKLYTRARRQIDVSLPPRRYEIAGKILAHAVEEALESPIALGDAIAHAAEQAGRQLAEKEAGPLAEGQTSPPAQRQTSPAAQRQTSRPAASDVPGGSTRTPADRLGRLLARAGYEPRFDLAGSVHLANCPFHEMAVHHARLVCEINRHLIQGVLDELGLRARATLDPWPNGCCVTIATEEEPEPR